MGLATGSIAKHLTLATLLFEASYYGKLAYKPLSTVVCFSGLRQ